MKKWLLFILLLLLLVFATRAVAPENADAARLNPPAPGNGSTASRGTTHPGSSTRSR